MGMHVRKRSALNGVEDGKCHELHPRKPEFTRSRQAADTVYNTAPEVDRRSLLEIFCWARDLCNAKVEEEYLGEHLIIKEKVV